ncbi:MAG TPA: glycosyltransferase family 39 protein [Acidimicrobiales bacterium]
MSATLEAPARIGGTAGAIDAFRRLVHRELRLVHPVLVAVGAVAVVVGVVLRFWAPTPLWLDEAISVNIARLPLTQIPRALAHDGAPPLYYVLLHGWMAVFGHSDFAVRALSGVTSVVSLPLFWAAGRRLGGRPVAWVTFFLAVSSPFAINYATSARMYSLMILWTVLGFLAVSRALEAPRPGRLLAVGAVTAAVLYTHYWGLYLVLVTGAWLAWRTWRTGRGGLVLRATIVGALAWLPWAPVFVFQALHTGTPWTSPASAADLLGVFGDFAGGGPWGGLLMFATFALFLLGVFGRAVVPGTTVEVFGPGGASERTRTGPAVMVELRPRPGMAPLVGVAFGTLLLAVVLGALANAAFVARYTAVVLPLFLLVVATGMAVLPGRRFRGGCLAVLIVAGLLTGLGENGQQRTQAGQIAAVLNVQAQAGDMVIYCPDQLGPAVDRLLKVPGVTQITFPRAIGPQRVDWVDYKKVIAATDVDAFTQTALARLGSGHTVWLVWRDGYAGLGGACGYLKSWLDLLRPTGTTLIHQNGGAYFEYENLVRYPS